MDISFDLQHCFVVSNCWLIVEEIDDLGFIDIKFSCVEMKSSDVLKNCWCWNFNWWFVFERPLGFFFGSNIWWFSSVCFSLWFCCFPCGPGSDEVDVLSVRPRFRRSRCFYPCGPGSDEVDVLVLLKVIVFDLSFYWIEWEWENCFFTSCYSSSLEYASFWNLLNFFSYVRLSWDILSGRNPILISVG